MTDKKLIEIQKLQSGAETANQHCVWNTNEFHAFREGLQAAIDILCAKSDAKAEKIACATREKWAQKTGTSAEHWNIHKSACDSHVEMEPPMSEPTNAEVLVDVLKDFAGQEDYSQEIIADYISCPSIEPCNYDGGSNHDCCTQCKIKWLLSKWAG